jgi:hypothetical protein
VRLGYEVVRVDRDFGGFVEALWKGTRLVRFEDFEAAELLVQNGEWLEFFGFQHLLVEPCPDLVLFDFW